MIGPMLHAWKDFVMWIRETYPVQEEFKFMYGKKYGWALRFRIKGKLLISLYPTQRGFTAQVILNQAALRQVRRIPLSETVQQVLAKARPYPEGKWLFIPVASETELLDIKRLLVLKDESS
ncbi:MAG TPA: DUF3788 family protein, partial [Terriglobales bacterium]|nr:DUF3788 family protein [Terriglobales bacterium]